MPKQKCTDAFAVYKGDDLIVVGTADEVVEFMGWKNRGTLWRLCSPSYKKKVETRLTVTGALVAYRLEDEVEEDGLHCDA